MGAVHRHRFFRLLCLVTCILVLLSAAAFKLDLDDHFYNAFLDSTLSDDFKEQAIWLPGYQLAHSNHLKGVQSNASGLTWSPETQTLFAVLNAPTDVLELSRSGEVLRRIHLKGFHDVEAIVWIADNRFIIVEERRHSLVTVEITPDTTSIERDSSTSFTFGLESGTNKGFEGVAWNQAADQLYVVKEQRPSKLLTFSGLMNSGLGDVSVQQNTALNDAARTRKSDLSGLHFDNLTGHLLVLSDESRLLAEVTLDGTVVSYMPLTSGWHGLEERMSQPEGVTMDDQGNLYILSEPNHFYRFESK